MFPQRRSMEASMQNKSQQVLNRRRRPEKKPSQTRQIGQLGR
jgi:hypothetical protein